MLRPSAASVGSARAVTAVRAVHSASVGWIARGNTRRTPDAGAARPPLATVATSSYGRSTRPLAALSRPQWQEGSHGVRVAAGDGLPALALGLPAAGGDGAGRGQRQAAKARGTRPGPSTGVFPAQHLPLPSASLIQVLPQLLCCLSTVHPSATLVPQARSLLRQHAAGRGIEVLFQAPGMERSRANSSRVVGGAAEWTVQWAFLGAPLRLLTKRAHEKREVGKLLRQVLVRGGRCCVWNCRA